MSGLHKLFMPESVAIIGASSTPGKNGYFFTKELLEGGFRGKVYPINPKGGDIDGKYKIYKSLDEVDDAIDVALFLVNKKLVMKAVEDCANHGVKFGVMYSAGFAETGEEGKRQQKEMIDGANAKGMRIVGPNCMGISSNACHLNLTGEFIPGGEIGFISQSGNLGFQLWNDAAKFWGTGFSHYIGFGNQADIFVHEYIDYLREDKNAKVIAIYLEGLKPGMGIEFIKSAAEAAKIKPVVLLKGGQSRAGSRATASHTGSLAGNNALFTAACEKAGIIQVNRLDELIPTAQTLMLAKPMQGNRIVVGGSGGGQMTVCTDTAERFGFEVPQFSKETYDKIASLLYDFSPKGNPFDQAGVFIKNLNIFAETAEISLDEKNIDGMFLFGMFGNYMPDLITNGVSWEQAMINVCEVAKRKDKPIVAYSVNARNKSICNDALRANGIPVFDSPDLAFRGMKALYEYGQIRNREIKIFDYPEPSNNRDIMKLAYDRNDKNLTEKEAYDLLRRYEIPMAEYRFATSSEEAMRHAEELGYPLVMKIVSPEIIHKSDVGGVKANLKNSDEVRLAYESMFTNCTKRVPNADIHGVILAKMVSGIEIIAGVVKDPQLGCALMIGLGGIFVEIIKDVGFCILPASKKEIVEKLKKLKGYPLLTGVRGGNSVDLDSLSETLAKVAQLALENPEIAEMDMNPIFASETGAMVADARIILS